ncbi:DnaJ domain [Dillenia turbinata]|uniref:DnaJ domain n=1 Tax=Dillenia turbinata TaxID=194707 RepID=A0AAN8UDZ7_9MAGN
MGRNNQKNESDAAKSNLVTEICSIACSLSSSSFIDWYLLLQVKENADTDTIRRQYLKLALQLHPDKNKHPKADIAFKLVSEGYSCLCDDNKRRAFDLERWKSSSIECNELPAPYSTCNFESYPTASNLNGLHPNDRLRSDKARRGLKDFRDRLKEEIRVIENCLKANTASRKEFPLFNPESMFEGYPHHRTRLYKKAENVRYLQERSLQGNRRERGKCVTPIFDIASEREKFRSKGACFI